MANAREYLTVPPRDPRVERKAEFPKYPREGFQGR